MEIENLKGFRVGRILDRMGRKSQDTAELFFEDVRVPAQNLLGGNEGRGFYQLMGDLPYERALIAVSGSWICTGCGAAHDRDVNAARNILTAEKLPSSVREPDVAAPNAAEPGLSCARHG